MRITKIIHTETGHRLTNYEGKCAHFHGHSYRWEVTIKGEPTDNGMVMDFKELKSVLKATIGELDHAFILHIKDPIIALAEGQYNLTHLLRASNGDEPRLIYTPFNPTVENITSWQASFIQDLLPKGIELAKIICWETENSHCEWTNE